MQHPLLSGLVVLRLHDEFTLGVGSVGNDFKVNVVLEGIHLSVASHYLKVSSEYLRAFLALFDKRNRLVVNYAVCNRFRMQKTSVNKEVTESEKRDSSELISSKPNQFTELLLALSNLILLYLFLSLVFESLNDILLNEKRLFYGLTSFSKCLH